VNARLRIVVYGLGAVAFFALAGAAWYRALRFWQLLRSATGIGAVSSGFAELWIELLIPLAGNLVILRSARQSRLATRLRRVHLLVLAATLASPFFLVFAREAWTLLVPDLLAGTQFAVLAAAYVVLSMRSVHASG
jgi:hypothetical protein